MGTIPASGDDTIMQPIPDLPEIAVASAMSAKVGLAARQSHLAAPLEKAALSHCFRPAIRCMFMVVFLAAGED